LRYGREVGLEGELMVAEGVEGVYGGLFVFF